MMETVECDVLSDEELSAMEQRLGGRFSVEAPLDMNDGRALVAEVRRLKGLVSDLMARPCIYCGCDHAPDLQRS